MEEMSPNVRYLFSRSGLPEAKWKDIPLGCDDIDFDSFQTLDEIREDIDESFFTEHYNEDGFVIEDNNLLICGKHTGCGKTSWSLKILKRYFENEAHRLNGVDANTLDKTFNVGLFIPVTKFLVDMKQFGNNDEARKLYNRLQTTELVVWDDLAAVHVSQYDYNVLYALIDYRIFSELPNIFTTNATSMEELGKEIGERLAERIWKTSIVVELKGTGVRGLKA